jgi:hypothetical protein
MPVCQSGLARDWISHLFHGPINGLHPKGERARFSPAPGK